jgi:hypothetical protein
MIHCNGFRQELTGLRNRKKNIIIRGLNRNLWDGWLSTINPNIKRGNLKLKKRKKRRVLRENKIESKVKNSYFKSKGFKNGRPNWKNSQLIKSQKKQTKNRIKNDW